MTDAMTAAMTDPRDLLPELLTVIVQARHTRGGEQAHHLDRAERMARRMACPALPLLSAAEAAESVRAREGARGAHTPLSAPENARARAVPDPIVAAVIADLARRSAVGVAKYGATLARRDLDLRDWLRHAEEEALDMALYLRRARVELDRAEPDGLSERGA